jgi:hypothetical protein
VELNAREFNLDLNRFSAQISADVGGVTKLAALKVFTGIVKKTPVDTGNARASWVIGIGRKAIPAPPSAGVSEDDTLLRTAQLHRSNGLQPIFISNYVPYINRLEDGHSQQAPTGMVALTLTQVTNQLNSLTR